MYYISVLKNGSTNSKKHCVSAQRQQRELRDNGLKRTHSRSLYFAVAMLSSRCRVAADRAETIHMMWLHLSVHRYRQQKQRHNDIQMHNALGWTRIRLLSILFDRWDRSQHSRTATTIKTIVLSVRSLQVRSAHISSILTQQTSKSRLKRLEKDTNRRK